MKAILSSARFISVSVLLALATGCASPKQTENLLTLAGFKPVAPSTAKQQQQLKALPPGKVTQVKRNGKVYYVFPDVAHDRVYVGSPKEYRNYLQIRADYRLSNETLADAKLDQVEPGGGDDWEGCEVVVWSE